MTRLASLSALVILGTLTLGPTTRAQTNQQPEDFTAVAVLNNNLGSGAGTVLMSITRWSSEAERSRLVGTLVEKGPTELLKALKDARSVGTIRTPDSLGYDLRYAHQERGEDGGRRIVIATDRPISFWEARNQPRTVDYPFTVIQMQIGADGKGRGTMSYAAKIVPRKDVFELENFGTAPIVLTEITARPKDK